LRSTRPKDANFARAEPNHADNIDANDSPASEEFYIRTFSRKDAAFVDATGRYPEPSYDGFEYHLIFVYKNYIHIELLADRSAQAYVKAYTDAFAFFAALKHIIKNVVLDNETSAALENHLTKNDVKFQLVPPNNKRSNKAERAIQTWRNHFIATLGTTNDKCPSNLWSAFITYDLLKTTNLSQLTKVCSARNTTSMRTRCPSADVPCSSSKLQKFDPLGVHTASKVSM
jgi:hypothetical protein